MCSLFYLVLKVSFTCSKTHNEVVGQSKAFSPEEEASVTPFVYSASVMILVAVGNRLLSSGAHHTGKLLI